MHTALAFIKRDFLLATSYKLAFALQVFGILVAVPVFFFMGSIVPRMAGGQLERYGGNYFAFLLIGFGFANYLYISIQSFNNSLRESQLMGTLEIVLLSPTSLWQLLVYSSLWVYIFTTAQFIMYLLGGLAFGLNLGNANVIAAVLVLLLSIPAFASLGILSASITMIIKRGEAINTAIASLSAILGGVLFPVDVMPRWLQVISKLLPVTHSLEAMRLALLKGAGISDLLLQISILLLFSGIFFPLSIICFHFAVRSTKRSGTLSQY